MIGWSVSMARGVKARMEVEVISWRKTCKGTRRATVLSGHAPIDGRESAADLISSSIN